MKISGKEKDANRRLAIPGIGMLVAVAIGLLMLGFYTESFGQRWIDPRLIKQNALNGNRVTTNTLSGAKITDATIPGSKMAENSWAVWYPVTMDSTYARAVKSVGTWCVDASNPPSVGYQLATPILQVMGFDADGGTTGDDIAYLTFPVPAQYETDTMSLDLYWFHLDDNGSYTADVVSWDGTCQAVGSGEDLAGAGTAMDAVETTCTASDSALYITTLNPEVEAIAAGDLVTIKLWVDESASSIDSGERAYLIGVLVKFDFKE